MVIFVFKFALDAEHFSKITERIHRGWMYIECRPINDFPIRRILKFLILCALFRPYESFLVIPRTYTDLNSQWLQPNDRLVAATGHSYGSCHITDGRHAEKKISLPWPQSAHYLVLLVCVSFKVPVYL